MRSVVVFTFSLLFAHTASAQNPQNQLFDCVNASSFEINSQCLEAKISQNIQFQHIQSQITEKASMTQGDKAMATMTFYPNEMRIDIVAHRDALATIASTTTYFTESE
ncbi:pyridine nucleotide transhydrogenase [Aestuariibacter sp. AA17]|uniref:Pyridine nucleotide transhydrogenase n=1 Tax=Fluctibacter corallii TaxID=2984329 RepID=A0ABT3AD82_9ALTE|nr:pyridine nucleotide transhydrogenase [Aestuariibacter sp. AA17]MCV2886631.1 pyridine nucleotide transhydrogenase [Aestuariibacter sp. AA17]